MSAAIVIAKICLFPLLTYIGFKIAPKIKELIFNDGSGDSIVWKVIGAIIGFAVAVGFWLL